MARFAAFTLVELLVVIAIIAILIGLLLAAVQSAREAARKTECTNHLRQLGVAALGHETQYGHFPTGGWGCTWTGNSNRGADARQPGGWVYNILPFIEEETLHKLDFGLTPTDKRLAAARVMQTPIKIMSCPSRRPPVPYPNAWPYTLANAVRPKVLARSDYAINSGDRGSNTFLAGPLTLEDGDRPNFPFPPAENFTGISFVRSTVTPAQITDGTSLTYLIGEAYLATRHYESGLVESDRGHMYSGMAPDTVRTTDRRELAPSRDGLVADEKRFGSAHRDGFNMVFCDGSVQMISYDIDRDVHGQQGNRRDSGQSP